MRSCIHIIVLTTIITCLSGSTLGEIIDCYSCHYNPATSADDNPCQDPFDEIAGVAMVKCNMTGQFCEKSKAVADEEVFLLSRSCVDYCKPSCKTRLGVLTCITCCQEDKCNFAPITCPSLVVISVTTLFKLIHTLL